MTSWAYYNENDIKAAAWLGELIRAGHTAPGFVDTRSIAEVQADDLAEFTQCHFFAGIGGWSYALRLAGWGDERPVWTGSCPCQPFSAAGKQRGFDDDRHLWPYFHRLIAKRRPDTVFGEQVAGKNGETWFDVVQSDMEREDYACGSVTFPACGVGAHHLRQRLYWVAHAETTERRRPGSPEDGRGWCAEIRGPGFSSSAVAHTANDRRTKHERESRRWNPESAGNTAVFQSAIIWVRCTDGKSRPIKPGIEPLAHGVPARVVRLRGYGNAIVPQQAAAFIESYMEV